MKITNQKIKQIKKEAEKHFQNLGPSHDWSHVQRVFQTAVNIAKKEKANVELVKIAVYLHDIGRKSLKEGNYDHAVAGAKMAKGILRKYNFTGRQIDDICHCIETHRFRNNKKPETKEAKCLFDADKLDVLGALGIARSYIYLGEVRDCVIYLKPKKRKSSSKKITNSVQEEYEVKYKHMPEQMMTKTGKIIAKQRLKYMQNFLKRLEREVLGKL
jgi:uncharacterized protein